MTRTTLMAVAVLTALFALPAQAAPAKPHGSYPLHLNPDPTMEVVGQTGVVGCLGLIAASIDHHPLVLPTKGKLTVDLVSPDPTNHGVTDWDLYVEDMTGEVIDGSHSTSSKEQTRTAFKKGQKVQIVVCNVLGMPDATVTYSFK